MKNKPSSKIFFRGLSVLASVGILPEEKAKKQTLLIDLEFSIDIDQVQSLNDTIDYALVRLKILELLERQHYDLLETLARVMTQELMDHFHLSWLYLKISKPDIFTDMDAVGISVECGF